MTKKVTNLVGIDPSVELWNKRESLKNNLGFQISDLKSMYVPGWKPASNNFWGEAKPY